MVSSTDFMRASERPTAIATLNCHRHLTPSCGGHHTYRGENSGPARTITENLTPRPGIREHNLPSADVQVMALFEPANSMLAPLPKATITVLFEPTISSHLQAPVRVSVLLVPKMWAPPPAQSKFWPEPINDAPAPSNVRPRLASSSEPSREASSGQERKRLPRRRARFERMQ
jgi:hypothetical protein